MKNVRFVTILARGENGVYIEGLRTGLIDGVLLENVRVEVDRWADVPAGHYDRRPYSGVGPIYAHPTAGFFVANAPRVTIRNCEVAWGDKRQEHFGAAVETSGVEDFRLEGFRGESA